MELRDVRVGVKVRNTKLFSGVPEGTIGVIVEVRMIFPVRYSVRWNRFPHDYLTDSFTEEELQYLEIV